MHALKEKSLVSVITPFYNRERYIRKCMDSILSQTYPHWELILVDDGSTDATAEICKAYTQQDARIKMVTNESNSGVAYSRNKGLDAATGEYIVFVDSDDFITNCYIERFLQIATGQNCEMVQCKMKWGCTLDSLDDFDKDAHYFMTVHRDRNDASLSMHDGRDSRIGGMVCAKIYHRRLFENIRFPLDKIHEDEAVMHRLVYEANGIAAIDSLMYYQVDSGSSIMRDTFSKKRYDIIDQLEDRYQFWLEKDLTDCAAMTAHRIGVQLIELYRSTKQHLNEDNKALLKQYADTLPRYIDAPFMTEEKKQLHLFWLDNPDEGKWYFTISYMREEFYKLQEWS
ncbi:MAG: glycosyltransferase family 2 protein [Defluviitaleaceae bacterium]|nr:glycosyltransferase family 2 protein [Defluviitaleaceae bacterium]